MPKITTGWFFRAESFFSVARYLERAALEAAAAPPDFLSHSHGEGFLRFFEERCSRQGIFIFDEPESALSPSRQVEFLKLLKRIDQSRITQVIMATHSPMLMAYPEAPPPARPEWPRADRRRGHRALPADARVLGGSARFRRGDDRLGGARGSCSQRSKGAASLPCHTCPSFANAHSGLRRQDRRAANLFPPAIDHRQGVPR
jgi:hypothetical protein